MKYAWIKLNKEVFDINLMCELLNVSASSYYDWFKQQPSPRQLRKQELAKQVKTLFMASRCIYGTRRLKKDLSKLGFFCKPKEDWEPHERSAIKL